MIWVLALHISALLFWCAALLYLPALIAASARQQTEITESPQHHDSLARFVFTHLATPAALLAIIFGTLAFIVDAIIDPWLIIKLTLVSALVIVHALSGILVLRLERNIHQTLRRWCGLLSAVLCVLMVAIVWLVLAKPARELLPWVG